MKNVTINDTSTETTIAWVKLYSDNLFSWALHKTSSKETAEDLVQETFMAAFNSFGDFKNESNPKTWLFSILNHKINDFYRKTYQTPVVLNNDIFDVYFNDIDHWKPNEMPQQWSDENEDLADDADFRRELNKCLKRLPPHWLSAVHLRFVHETKSHIICQELGITDTNLWQILHRAKLQLRKCLEINWFKSK